VDDAFAAGALFLLEGAFVESQKGVCFEFSAFGAEFTVGAVVAFAVDFDHVADGFLFAFHAFVFGVWGLHLHFNQT
jgi:hypothetical protein